MNRPSINRVLETALYVEDINRSAEFYMRVFGFPVLVKDGSRFCALDVSGQQVLLLFKKGATAQPIHAEGGIVPQHHGEGNLHVAFAITTEEYDSWRRWLGEMSIPIESEVRWPLGGRSLYFRDPDIHCVELVTPGTWRTY
jgi:catechol 2,3-dioxygenase-like lactoylglutathione lyase family enzyme